MLRAIGTLTQATNPSSASLFAAAELTAAHGNWLSEANWAGTTGR